MTLLDHVTFWIRKDANKHGLWQREHSNIDDYIAEKVNAMTQYDLLEAISDALEAEKLP